MAMIADADDVDWVVAVTEPLPECPSVRAAWTRLATQSTWHTWRPPSRMRGKGVTTTVVPPATEPLTTGDAYVVRVNRFLTIRCRVLESPSRTPTADDDEMVFDATGVALGGLVRARFRFTVFLDDDGTVMARAQEGMVALPMLRPSTATLESEHRHTLRALRESFRTPSVEES